MAAFDSLQKISVVAPEIQEAGPVPLRAEQFAILKLKVDEGLKHFKWEVVSTECKRQGQPLRKGEVVAGLSLGSDGTISGYPEPGTVPCKARIAVVDARGRQDEIECKIL